MIDGESFGQLVRRMRLVRRWTQEQLAQRAELDQSTISQIELDKARHTVTTVTRLAHAFEEEPQEWTYRAGLLPRPPEQATLPTTADPNFDPQAIVAYVESNPDPIFRADMERLRGKLAPAAYARICLAVYRAWGSNGAMALRVAEEVAEK